MGRPFVSPSFGRARRQRGATGVMVALFLIVTVAALGALDIGNVFFARRSLQRVADLAALAAVQTVGGGCAQAGATGTANAAANGFAANGADETLAVVCGRWDLKQNSGPSYFATSGTPLNGVQVTVTRKVPYLFLGPARTISAAATAQATDIGTFTVGTALAQLNGGLVNSLLNGLLGANLSLSLVSYESLANARIKIGDLMAAMGVGTVDELLSTQVSAGSLAQFMLTALSQTSIADANLQTDLATLQAIVNGGISNTVQFPLGNTSGTAGLLSLGLSDPQSAINATISPFDALMVAAEIARAGQGPIDISAGLNLGTLTNATVKVQILQPPVLATGEAGVDPATGTWRTQANAAQIRLYLDLGVNVGLVSVNLPLSLEAAQGQAWLEATNCTSSTATSSSVIGGQTGIANICVAAQAATAQAVSQPFSCPTQPATIVSILGIPVTARVWVPLVGNPIDPPLSFPPSGGYSSFGTGIGQSLTNAISGSLQLGGANLSAVTSALAPVLGWIGGIGIDPLLQLLGVQVGVTTIHDLSLTCGVPSLVF